MVMSSKIQKIQEVTLAMEDKELEAKDVLVLLADHENECNARYERIEERLEEQKSFLLKLDMRLWGLAALIVATAIAERFV